VLQVWPAAHWGRVVLRLQLTVWPAPTVLLKAWTPLTLTTIGSGAVEQLVAVPLIVTAPPGQAEAGPVAVTATHGPA
jgi:hypothetical protein